MDPLSNAPYVFRAAVALILCLTGFVAIVVGLRTMLAGDYQQSLKRLSVQSAQIGPKAIGDVTVGPVIEAAAQLITAVNQLVRTAVGVGVYLSTGGVILVLIGYGLFPR